MVKPLKTAGQEILTVRLPKAGSWVDIDVAGRYPRASIDHRGAVIEIHLAYGRTLSDRQLVEFDS
jgi:hypothetical protein